MRVFGWDENPSQPSNYDIDSYLLTDFGWHIHPTPEPGGFLPIQGIVANTIGRVVNGPCLTCIDKQFDAHESRVQWDAYTEVFFGSLGTLDGFTMHNHDGPVYGTSLIGNRINTNYLSGPG